MGDSNGLVPSLSGCLPFTYRFSTRSKIVLNMMNRENPESDRKLFIAIPLSFYIYEDIDTYEYT